MSVTKLKSAADLITAAWHTANAPLAIYVVVERWPSDGTAIIREQSLPAQTREDIVRELIECQWDNPHKVLFVDEANGICRNVTADIAEQIVAYAETAGDTLHEIVVEFVENAIGELPSHLRRAA